MCGGSGPTSVTLGNTTSGGTWTSSNTSLATIGSITGVVTGVAAGSPTITYTMPGGCFSVYTVTVNAVAAITGAPNMCIGGTTSLSDATSGGVWSSSNTSVATIGTSGVVNGIALGSSVISYAVASMGCSAVLTVNVTNPPTTYAVTGGGAYCAGASGVHIGLNSSDVGVTYYLFNGATLATTLVGTGSAIDFGLFTASGTYTVIANFGSTCSATMSGSATVSVNPLPTAFSVTGGGAYCSGGAGSSVSLSTSTIGVNYQLMLGATPMGSPIAGTGSTLSFGPQTTAGTYTVVATNGSTGCVNNMAGSAVVSINSLPTAFSVTGGGGYCLGAAGVHIGLGSSAVGVNYQLLLSGSPVGSALAGTGGALDFGFITTAGSYTVQATNTATGCTNSMSGTATVVINPLPTVFTVTGGGAYCLGGTGVAVGLNGSTVGINYQLFNGSTPAGAPVAGTGVALTFGNQTTTGSYTVVATNATTGCVNNMFGSVSVSTNPLPTVFTVTGGGGYCAGGPGVAIGLSGSLVGTSYSLFQGTTLVSAASGTGSPLNFGLFTGAGTYTVQATTTSTGCTGNMSGSVVVTINPLPTVFTVTGGGVYCAGGTGVTVGLSGSTSGVSYQLYNGTTPVGATVAGSGSSITFGLQTGAGSYTVVAINNTTTCTNNMSGSVIITVNPLPTIYAVTGGGGYCSGGTGVNVGLAASNTGINYQLYNGASTFGGPVTGTGSALGFGLITTAGTYTVSATNPSTGCTTGMSGSATITINPLPTVFSVGGGGSYCAGGTGVNVTLSNSTSGVNYQLMNAGSPMGGPVAGTGSLISFGPQTTGGTYTVVATNATTGCTNNMSGTATIGINPLPTVFTVTGGGSYCAGTGGLHVGLSGSVAGTTYQLMNGLATVGLPMSGTGGALDFGFQTAAGTYTVVATTTATGCTNNMTGSVTISINPLPALYTISGGGSYCAGGTGVSIGLNSSAIGNSYQLYVGGTPSGSPMVGTGLALNFGLRTAAGTYTIIATNMATGCQATMSGTTTISVNPLPALHNVTGGGSFCVGGTGVHIGVDATNSGINYQLYNGATAVGAPIPGNTGFPIDFGLQTGLGIYTVKATNTTTGCTVNMTGTATIGTYPLPIVFNVTGGGNYCSGGSGVNVGLSGSTVGVTYQLWNGGLMVGSSVSGSGLALNFGAQTTPGTYTVVATSATTGCSNNMNASATVGVNALPTLYTVTGGGNYCAGGTGVVVGLSGSDVGTTYQLMNGGPVGTPVAGTGSALNFGLQTAGGTYTVLATNTGTTCQNMMTGGVMVTINTLPTAYTLTGGGNYCSGGAGVDIMLGGSDPGLSYQLMRGTTMVGTPMVGTGSPLDFGMQTGAGVYSVVATDPGTLCTGNMSGTVSVNIDPLPTAYIVTGGGNYCAGGTGVHVMLSGSNSGVSYQLMNGGPVGPAMTGTGMGLDFGLQTSGGIYTIVATNNTTGCVNNMSGSATVVVNPLPTLYGVASTSSTYCAGGTGVDIWVTGSDVGTTYQLYNGSTTIGSPHPGTGAAVDFGLQFPSGLYTVVAVNTATGCTRTMGSTVTVIVNPLPPVFTITGGGGYCAGGNGVHVGLSGSTSGISYQLYLGSVATGSPVIGTGGPLDFGLQTATGTYTVVATNNATTCTSNMSGSVAISVNPLPSLFSVSGGGNYCAGGTGMPVSLSGSSLSVNYQLYRGVTTLVGTAVAGTGTTLSFGNQTTAGTYTVVATDAITGCTTTMAGNAIIGINAAPVAFSVVGGGNFCPGGSGVHVGIAGSNTGISYQLYNGVSTVGVAVTGTGSAIDFGLQSAPGTYTVKATNSTTGCMNTMSGSAIVVVNALPTVYNVIGGGHYCAGGSGVHVGINNSTPGVNYTLFRDVITPVTVLPGTGSPVDFGTQTISGTYTIHASNATTGCSANMSGSVTVDIDPILTPNVSITTGIGDTICEGTFTTFTAVTVNGGGSPLYQWTVNGSAAAVGPTYSYVPTNGDIIGVTLTSNATCATPAMVSNTKTITVDPNQNPVVSVSTNPGTVVCQGTSVTFTANPSYGGNAPTYVWVKNTVNVGTAPTYTYTPADGDVVYAIMTSNYHCRLANTASSSHITMQVDKNIPPVVTITAHPGTNLAPGQSATFNATVTNGGPTPVYQWLVNGIAVPGANMSSFTTSTLADDDSVTAWVTSSGGCAGLTGFNSLRVRVAGVGVNQVAATGSEIRLIPNPSKGTFTVKGNLGILSNDEVSLEVTDMLGQVVYTGSATAQKGELNKQVDLGDKVANGMYILNVRSAAGNKVFHLVIEQ